MHRRTAATTGKKYVDYKPIEFFNLINSLSLDMGYDKDQPLSQGLAQYVYRQLIFSLGAIHKLRHPLHGLMF